MKPASDHPWRQSVKAAKGRKARKARYTSPRLNLTCPTCGTPRALTPSEASRGYQCSLCADIEEGAF
jgi:hypothetical protein